MFSKYKILLWVVLVLAVGGSVYAFWKHYDKIIEKNSDLASQVSELELEGKVLDATIEAQSEALDEWTRASEVIEARLQEIADGQVDAKAEREKLIGLFAKHDLGVLLEAKPGLILNRVNSGTADILSELQCASGSTKAYCQNPNDTSTQITVSPPTGTD